LDILLRKIHVAAHTKPSKNFFLSSTPRKSMAFVENALAMVGINPKYSLCVG
jgi:hypothetical protein